MASVTAEVSSKTYKSEAQWRQASAKTKSLGDLVVTSSEELHRVQGDGL